MYTGDIKEFTQDVRPQTTARIFNFHTQKQKKESESRSASTESTDVLYQRGKYTSHFQPIVNIGAQGQHIAGFETLSRDKKQPDLTVGEYLNRLRDNNQLFEHDCQMFENACEFLSELQRHGNKSSFVSVNFSAQTLSQHDLPAFLEFTLAQYQLDPSCLKIEITEEEFPETGRAQILDNIYAIHDRLKMRVAMDDFGTEASNEERLSLLGAFISSVKIDKSLLGDADLIALASSPALKNYEIIVEGVSTDHQYAMLCNLFEEPAIQAYALHKPMCKDQALQIVNEHHSYNFD